MVILETGQVTLIVRGPH